MTLNAIRQLVYRIANIVLSFGGLIVFDGCRWGYLRLRGIEVQLLMYYN